MERTISFLIKRFILFSIFFCLVIYSMAQLSVVPVQDPSTISGKKGVLYNLPRTTIVVEVQVERTEQIKGPLSQYSETSIGVSDVIKENKTTYSIEGISLKAVNEPDPSRYFFIEWGTKTDRATSLQVSPGGTLVRYSSLQKLDKEYSDEGKFEYVTPLKAFPVYRAGALKEQVDSVIRKISIDTLYFEKLTFRKYMIPQREEDKAAEASQIIEGIKRDKYSLLVGYQETAYEKEAIEFMLNRLEEMEREYLKLFTGVTYRQTQSYTFYYTPPEELVEEAIPLFGFSESMGIIPSKMDGSDIVMIISPEEGCIQNSLSDISFPAEGITYRVPCTAEIVVNHGVRQELKQKLPICQYGTLSLLPPNTAEVIFDEETGIPVKVVMLP